MTICLRQNAMVEAVANETPAPTVSADPRPAEPDAGKSGAAQSQAAGKAGATGSSRAASATIDELLAKEALANLKRSRAAMHTQPVQFNNRAPIPAATLVVKKPQPQAWKAPFVALAVVVAISSLLSAGGFTYLLMRPMVVATTSGAELRSLRESVAQLRRTVASLSTDLSTTRATLDTASKAASDRFSRIAQGVERLERDQSLSATKLERLSENKVQVAGTATATPSPEITGTVQQRPARPPQDVIVGWRLRRAYEGVAILDGPLGVIEVVQGQDVPSLGRIDDIKFENGRWQVSTREGIILPAR